ncbi:MAG: 5-formyltetrahydrofolate cyclo-ligase [Lachnospiraceae bacterium]|nr:5-formyltetrahydrofolate cyclo-ligase [Lachnospiraceae bacterium]
MEKEALRKEMNKLRDAIDEDKRRQKSEKAFVYLTSMDVVNDCDDFLMFFSTRSEIDTIPLLAWALEHGKKVYAPKIEGKRMSFYEVTSLDDLVPGAFGILEPSGIDTGVFRYKEGDGRNVTVLFPGLAFDLNGNRIGYGAGYYDHFMPQIKGTAVGYCFDEQIIDRVPIAKYDYRMDYLVTDQEIIRIRKKTVTEKE